MAKRTGRQKTQLPTCYFEGYLDKRSFKDKTSRKLWACLCGNTLFFFNDKRDTDYVEKLNLSGFMSITDDSSQDRNLEAARLNLQLKDGNIKFTAPSAEARELWKGYIHSVAELAVPSSLNLLPGQMHMLREVVEEEKKRIKTLPPPSATNENPYISLKTDMPACYYEVSRLEAELLLERESKRGNLLLRPGQDGNSFAVSSRQDLEGPIFRHYRVTRKHEGGFSIDVDSPVPCATLHDVINYVVEKTGGVLIPLITEGIYERRISFIWSDKENGEKSVQQAPSNLVPPSVPPKPGQRIPTPQQEPEQDEEENVYLNDSQTVKEEEKEREDSSEVPLSQLAKKNPKRAILPPTPAPRKMSTCTPPPSSASPPNSQDKKMRVHPEAPGQIPFLALSELKLKLEEKARTQE